MPHSMAEDKLAQLKVSLVSNYSPYLFDDYRRLKMENVIAFSFVTSTGSLKQFLCNLASLYRCKAHLKQLQPTLYRDLCKLNMDMDVDIEFNIPRFSKILSLINREEKSFGDYFDDYDGYENKNQWVNRGDLTRRIVAFEQGYINRMVAVKSSIT